MSKRLLTQIIDLNTKVVISEKYTKNGRLHRDPDDGPALIERFPDTGRVGAELYKINGMWHRENGPALVIYDELGNIRQEEYWFRNMRHRDPSQGPAQVTRWIDDGVLVVTKESYYVSDEPYRDPKEGPFFIGRERVTGEHIWEDFSSPDESPPASPRPLIRKKKIGSPGP